MQRVTERPQSLFPRLGSIMRNSNILDEGKHKVLWEYMDLGDQHLNKASCGRGKSESLCGRRKSSSRDEKYLPAKYPWQL